VITDTNARISAAARVRGVTLIELMIVVVVVAILASIAVPSYRNYVIRSQRTDATAALLRLAAAQEKFYLQNNTYAANASQVGGASSEHGWYTIAVNAANTNGFSASATVTAGGAQAKDTACNSFTIDESGQRGAKNKAGTTNMDCWR